MHNLILGQTGSGKSTLAAKLLQKKRAVTGRPIIVLDPNLDPLWEADFLTDDPAEFREIVFGNRSCEIVIDESGETIGKYSKEMMPLATRVRHFGHISTFVAQRAQQIDINVRSQCSVLYCFSQCKKDAVILADDFGDEELKNACNFGKGEFYLKKRMQKIMKLNSFEIF